MRARLELVVPGLCGPLPSLDGLDDAAAPLVKLLSRAVRRKQLPGYERQLAALFGIRDDQTVSSAACSMLGHGLDPGDHSWIHADPVYMLADMDHAVMFDAHSLDISEDESEQLVDLFNAHFANDTLALVLAGREHWFMRLHRDGIETSHIAETVGRNVNLHMPRGDDATFWRSLLNETQMLFHGSEVNVLRESLGQPPVNSLWLWGEGSLPAAGSGGISRVYADDGFALGLARLHETPAETLPGDAGQLQSMMQANDRVLLVLTPLYWPASYGDADAWLQALDDLLQQWLIPLAAPSIRNNMEMTLYPCNGLAYHFRTGLLNKFNFRFWRRGRLADYVDTQQAT